MTKVSIITPFYNAEKFLAQSIESALSQTWSNKEIILINDGSSDNSLCVAKRYESANVKVISIENSGQCAATNTGLNIAQGDFIQYLDADDILHPDKIAIQIGCLINEPHCVAIGPWARFTDDISKAVFVREEVWKSAVPADWIKTQWNGGGMMANSAYLIPRNISEKAGYYDESLNYNNDFEYFTRVVLSSNQVIFCDEAKTYYRSEINSSLSQRRSYEAALSEYNAKRSSIIHLLKLNTDQSTKESCASAMFSFLYNLDPNYSELFKTASKDIDDLSVKSFKISQKKLDFLSRLIGWKSALTIRKVLLKH